MAYTKLKLTPADGSTLNRDTDRHADMVSSDGKTTITFTNERCRLRTEKGSYILKQSHDANVYYTTIGKWYVCYNGAALSWRDNSK